MPVAAIGAIANVAGGLIGNAQANQQRQSADAARQQALQAFSGINIPSVAQQQLSLGTLQQQGQLNPLLQQLVQQEQSGLGGYQKNLDAVEAQKQALQQLQKMGQSGLTAADMSELQEINRNTSAQNQAQQKQILQNMAARGVGGSGAELAARLAANQASAVNANQSANQLQQAALQRQLQAITQGASLGQSMENQNFNEAQAIANQQNAINQFNAQQRANVQAANVGAQNQAQASNLGEKQRVSDTNVGLQNQQQLYNKELLQKQFENQMKQAGAMAGQYGNIAAGNENAGNRIADQWANIGQGAGNIINAFGNKPK